MQMRRNVDLLLLSTHLSGIILVVASRGFTYIPVANADLKKMKKGVTAKMLFFLLSLLLLFREATCSKNEGMMWGSHSSTHFPLEEQIHFPEWFTSTMTPFVNGTDTKISDPNFTPDYRIEEPPFFAYNYHSKYLREEERPYRISPHTYQTKRWPTNLNADMLGCYCTTVYKRFTLLAGCAILTTRHIITTATSTEHILKHHRHKSTLENILGAWYDHNDNTYNSSLYMTPARIHYHPQYRGIHAVNASHPIPCIYDLAVWAATYKFPGYYGRNKGVVITCQRAASGWFYYTSSIPWPNDLVVIVGFQFIKAYRRVPRPWYKYAVRTRKHVLPCPKTEWGWFHCVMGDWAKLGLDSGAAFHMSFERKSWRYDGFAGLNAFSMKLRSLQIIHYFTVIDTYPVLDFMYDAFLGRQKYEYLDGRFYDSQWTAPRPKPWWPINVVYDYATAYYKDLPYY